MSSKRGSWGSRIGFILAASGSAIGLGNIVFFPANAYKYGGGAFYLPYFIALFLIGIPIMAIELGLGRHTKRALPTALGQVGGKRGEMVGWFCVFNASVITMYYITILAWVVGMLLGSLGSLWRPSAVQAFGLDAGVLSNAMSYFFNMISKTDTIAYVVIVWLLNMVVVMWGTRSIEKAVKLFVPLMWLIMIVLIVRGITLPNGIDGIYLLFTPKWSVMKHVEVWQGAFSQMFFTLSLGLGIMTAYASYLPKKSDDTGNALTISLMNCGFEFIAGLAIFSLLFAFAITPKASTLSMMFFVVPEGISQFPVLVRLFGILFFGLLLMAGLTSSVSLVESLIASVIDKFQMPRKKVVLIVCLTGMAGSILFALPTVVDRALNGNGTLGLTLLDLFDHWAFSYGLLIVGFFECIFLGWLFDVNTFRAQINEFSRFKLGPWFNTLIRWVMPLVILSVLLFSAHNEIRCGLYGGKLVSGFMPSLHIAAVAIWVVYTLAGAFVLTRMRGASKKGSK